jgi:hypothetical protein
MDKREDLTVDRWQKRISKQGKVLNIKESPPTGRGDIKKRRTTARQMFQSTPPSRGDIKPNSDIIYTPLGDVKPKIDRSVFSNPAGARYKSKEPKNLQVSNIIQEYINIWNASHFPELREFKPGGSRVQTNKFKDTIRAIKHLISGKLYTGEVPNVRLPNHFKPQKVSIPPHRFKFLVENFERKAFNPDYLPRNKSFLSKTTLLSFLIGNGTYGSVPSLLLEHGLTHAIPNLSSKPKDPQLFDSFLKLFLRKLGKPEEALTIKDKNNLVGASNIYLHFFTQFKESFEFYGYTDPIAFLDYYWQALENDWPGANIRKIPTTYLNNKIIINKTLVTFFLKVNLLRGQDLRGTSLDYWAGEEV